MPSAVAAAAGKWREKKKTEEKNSFEFVGRLSPPAVQQPAGAWFDGAVLALQLQSSA
jgi:hypothetical protein